MEPFGIVDAETLCFLIYLGVLPRPPGDKRLNESVVCVDERRTLASGR